MANEATDVTPSPPTVPNPLDLGGLAVWFPPTAASMSPEHSTSIVNNGLMAPYEDIGRHLKFVANQNKIKYVSCTQCNVPTLLHEELQGRACHGSVVTQEQACLLLKTHWNAPALVKWRQDIQVAASSARPRGAQTSGPPRQPVTAATQICSTASPAHQPPRTPFGKIMASLWLEPHCGIVRGSEQCQPGAVLGTTLVGPSTNNPQPVRHHIPQADYPMDPFPAATQPPAPAQTRSPSFDPPSAMIVGKPKVGISFETVMAALWSEPQRPPIAAPNQLQLGIVLGTGAPAPRSDSHKSVRHDMPQGIHQEDQVSGAIHPPRTSPSAPPPP